MTIEALELPDGSVSPTAREHLVAANRLANHAHQYRRLAARQVKQAANYLAEAEAIDAQANGEYLLAIQEDVTALTYVRSRAGECNALRVEILEEVAVGADDTGHVARERLREWVAVTQKHFSLLCGQAESVVGPVRRALNASAYLLSKSRKPAGKTHETVPEAASKAT